ncbi:MAG TPA: hypothetical protein PLP19_16605 [bacterium]|nr:hypothetical protein [bacterium]HPN45115.1 hypothetical protein [bacterium]
MDRWSEKRAVTKKDETVPDSVLEIIYNTSISQEILYSHEVLIDLYKNILDQTFFLESGETRENEFLISIIQAFKGKYEIQYIYSPEDDFQDYNKSIEILSQYGIKPPKIPEKYIKIRKEIKSKPIILEVK